MFESRFSALRAPLLGASSLAATAALLALNPGTARAQSGTASPVGTTPLPLQSSAIVHKNKSGGLAIASANGAPIDGVKVSTHDLVIQSPSIVVAPNGAIHIAFLEQIAANNIACAIYHRFSSDGGRTWSPAKNLSESMPDLNVGGCQIAADGAGRVYVVWNVASAQYARADLFPHSGGGSNNLVYRVWSGGQWNGKPIPIHQMATQANQNIGSDSYFVSTDSAGVVRIVWNEIPDRLHPEVQFAPGQHASGVSDGGLVMEATLNGNTPSAPRQIYMNPVGRDQLGPAMDGLDMLTGYVDATDQAHLFAQVTHRGDDGTHFKVIEQNTQTPGVDLPGRTFDYWNSPPRLLVDAQGRKHIVTMYQGGEHANVRDYVVGSDTEPTTIRSVGGTGGALKSLEAVQGPGGHMLAIMDMNDTGDKTGEELYVSMSSGGAWSPPVNVTNNTGRLSSHYTATSSRSNVATMSWGYPGAATGTFDKSGHLLLLYVRNKMSVFGSSAFGVQLAGGNTATPNLMFLRF